MKNKIFVYLFNGYSDWEIAYLSPEIKKSSLFDLVYFSENGKSAVSMSGLRVQPDISLSEISIDDICMLILPGGTAWGNRENTEINQLVRTLFDRKTTIAAICGATEYLAQQGLLNQIKHTSNNLGYLKMVAPEYLGDDNYIDSLAVTDKNIITAKGVAPIEFAREVFTAIKLYSDKDTEKWYQLFKNGIWSE